MDIQWSLVLFTALTGMGGWLFFFICLNVFVRKTDKGAFAGTATALALTVVGGLASVTHLSHPDRMLGALQHPTSGIFTEALLVGLLAIVMIAFLVMLRRGIDGGALKAVAVVGMALGAKHLGKDTKVFALVGDGESQEGQIWEAYMAAAHYKLDNLTVIIDNNGLQIDGSNDQVMSLGDLGAKLRAFGFDLVELPDGNDLDAVEAALSKPTMPGKPKAILAHTVKGKGVSFMENQVGWHGKAPNAEQRDQALKELEG